jgi:hypothetical protein
MNYFIVVYDIFNEVHLNKELFQYWNGKMLNEEELLRENRQEIDIIRYTPRVGRHVKCLLQKRAEIEILHQKYFIQVVGLDTQPKFINKLQEDLL